MPEATVLHVDLDAFYVSMECIRRPELRGKPVIVCGGLGPRGVVNTCSYEARVFGVRSAMPVSQARRLCPAGIYLPSDFGYYAGASKAFHAILREFTPVVEVAGADEAYLDVAGSEALFGDPPAMAQAIRARIAKDIGITASVGIATNKLVAKVASDAAKPDGVCHVPAGHEAAFLAPRALRELPGIGPKSAAALNELGVKTIGDVASLALPVLQSRFGRGGADLWERARGIHHSPVLSERAVARSISRETTFGEDETDVDQLHAVLRRQSEHVADELARQQLAARTIGLKLRFPPFETMTRSSTPGVLVSLADDIYRPAVALFERAWELNAKRPVRLVGVGVSGITEGGHQLRLGEGTTAIRLAGALAEVRERFGDGAIRRGIELKGEGSRRDGGSEEGER